MFVFICSCCKGCQSPVCCASTRPGSDINHPPSVLTNPVHTFIHLSKNIFIVNCHVKGQNILLSQSKLSRISFNNLRSQKFRDETDFLISCFDWLLKENKAINFPIEVLKYRMRGNPSLLLQCWDILHKVSKTWHSLQDLNREILFSLVSVWIQLTMHTTHHQSRLCKWFVRRQDAHIYRQSKSSYPYKSLFC